MFTKVLAPNIPVLRCSTERINNLSYSPLATRSEIDPFRFLGAAMLTEDERSSSLSTGYPDRPGELRRNLENLIGNTQQPGAGLQLKRAAIIQAAKRNSLTGPAAGRPSSPLPRGFTWHSNSGTEFYTVCNATSTQPSWDGPSADRSTGCSKHGIPESMRAGSAIAISAGL
jgi:hypothetical protein